LPREKARARLGLVLPEESLQSPDGFLAEVMLDPLSIHIRLIFADPKGTQEIHYEVMTLGGGLGHSPPLVCQLNAARARAGEQALSFKALESPDNGDVGDSENILKIRHAGALPGGIELMDGLDVILGQLIGVLFAHLLVPAGSILGVKAGWHLILLKTQ